MPVNPGGKKYWLPLFSNNVLAKLIVYLAQEKISESKTYTLTPNKSDSLNMVELNQLIARELVLIKPRISVPVPVLATALKSGIGKLLKLPAETLAFLSQASFDNQETINLAQKLGITQLDVNELLPNVIADLDYRFTYSNQAELPEFSRHVVDKMIYFKKEGKGTPWVIIHGLFSDAVELKELALKLNLTTGKPVYVIDLPGLGHSPIINKAPTVAEYVKRIKHLIKAIGVPVNILGHSIGANLAAKVAELNTLEIEELVLVQPLTKKTNRNKLLDKVTPQQKLLKLILSRLSKKKIKKYLVENGSFIQEDVELDRYSERMHQSLKSPRLLATNANLMALINHASAQINWEKLPAKTTILWGELDKAYFPPLQSFYPVHHIAAGHQLPMSAMDQVVAAIQNL